MNVADIAFEPLLPWPAIMALAVAGLLIFALAVWRRAPGSAGRALAFLTLLAALAGPNLRIEDRTPEKDVAVLLVDRSSSMTLRDRRAQSDAAAAAVEAAAVRSATLDLRTVIVPPAPDEDRNGTRMMQALTDAFAGVPRDRRAGAIMVTDGQVHDAPSADDAAARLAPVLAGAPLHALLVGEPDEGDRRVRIVAAPPFALVGSSAEITFVVEDEPYPGRRAPAAIDVFVDGVIRERLRVWPDRETTIAAPIDHAGQHAIEISVDAGPREVSLVNNKALANVAGVRDRLRVLMVSGQPHAGERVWRNLLKSDPAVDLVHFTILRPPEKLDFTPTRELALIPFPIQELFERKLHDFDLIIFDRYPRRDLIPPTYLANIVEFVRRGGALLEAADITFADPKTSLAESAIGAALPALPTGRVLDGAFRPKLSRYGERHPVTAPLASRSPDTWGRWHRQVDTTMTGGSVLMTGADDRPLLALARFGDGRVAQILSDQIWLWARGHEGGGPHGELMRRLAHWLMAEPELEETRLKATVIDDMLQLERFTVEDDASALVDVQMPDGSTAQATLARAEDGRATGAVPAPALGLYRATEGGRTALAMKGDPSGPEAQEIRADGLKLKPALAASAGAAWALHTGVPDLRMAKPGRAMHGRGWIGLRSNEAYSVTRAASEDLPPAWLALLLVTGGLFWGWLRERR